MGSSLASVEGLRTELGDLLSSLPTSLTLRIPPHSFPSIIPRPGSDSDKQSIWATELKGTWHTLSVVPAQPLWPRIVLLPLSIRGTWRKATRGLEPLTAAGQGILGSGYPEMI